MDLEGIVLSEISQTEKDNYYISLTCGIWKIQHTNEYYKKKKEANSQTEDKLVVNSGEK